MQAEAGFDVTSIPREYSPLGTLDNNFRQSRYAQDEKLFIQFKVEPVLNPSKSTKGGRPIYDDVDMIIIRTPGSQLTSIVSPMRGEYMQRFGAQYEKWKATQKQGISGTPLESFPALFNKPSAIAELKALHIHTVEQLVALPDSSKQRIMGGHELCRRAAQWIEATSGTGAKLEQLAEENAALKARLDALDADKSSAKEPRKKE